MNLPTKKRVIIQSVSGISIALFLFLESVFGILPMPINENIAASPATARKSNHDNTATINYFQKSVAFVFGTEKNVGIFPNEQGLFEYVEVVDSCDPYFDGECLNARSGAGEDHNVVMRLRNGMVLKIGSTVNIGEKTWYEIKFDEQIRYPERIKENLYVAGEYVRAFLDEGELNRANGENAENEKRIVVNRKKQMLYAYDNDTLFMETQISTGAELTPTPRGQFAVFKKTPSRYMQGPLPGITDQYYDLPGVPWNLYFTSGGAVIHGAYWHNKFGQPWSHGCVNVPLAEAQKLYKWADLGTQVIVQD